jgi:hypothetical protein
MRGARRAARRRRAAEDRFQADEPVGERVRLVRHQVVEHRGEAASERKLSRAQRGATRGRQHDLLAAAVVDAALAPDQTGGLEP